MTVIADFSIPADEFVLGHLLEVRPGVQVRLESMIPTGEATIPYFWIRSPDVEQVEQTLQASTIVESVHRVDEVDDETLFRVDWTEDIDGFIEAIAAADAVVLEGIGHGDHWSFQLRFPGNESLSAFYRDVVDKGIPVDLGGVHRPVETAPRPKFGLTPEQSEALSLALDAGYFAVPREVTLVGLAEELDISDSAVSQRIRRGLTKVLSATIPNDSSP